MGIMEMDRRAGLAAGAMPPGTDTAGIVHRAILIRARSGSTCAIEYLKGQRVAGSVIRRVMTGESIRADDRRALALLASQA
ncbi:hypothetical protein [uncultured Massilia sp.]|uniref:hypothetical protein n=1 Tax=uncultured Massilia sp. TaxID=169973 RepID=UPI0025E7CD09|nr:hypothetical protein [uncultured Massilia sp.]